MMRVQWDSVSKFVGFMTILTCLRITLFSFADQHGLSHFLPDFPFKLLFVPTYRFGLVWWEDAVFALPFVFLWRWGLKEKFFYPLFTVFSLVFGIAHAYQGWWAITILSFYPLVSMKMAMKHGMGTVMVCHVIFFSEFTNLLDI